MARAANATIDHDFIRKWVEERGGKPARVKRSGKGDDPGILRIDFPGFSGESTLQEISWDRWFKAFEANRLAFLYQETIDDQPSRFNKLVSRDSAKLEAQGQQPSEGEEQEEEEEGEEEEGEEEEGEEEEEKAAADTEAAAGAKGGEAQQAAPRGRAAKTKAKGRRAA